MVPTPDTTWLERFAARLLRLRPELTAVEAVRIARRQFAKASHLDPAAAAESYVEQSATDE